MNIEIQQVLDSLERMLNRGILPMNEEEYLNSLVVANALKGYPSKMITRGRLSFNTAKERALTLFDMYPNLALKNEIENISFHHVVTQGVPVLKFSTSMNVQDTTQQHYSVRYIEVPRKTDMLSPYYLAHEMHHTLKDCNPDEYLYMLRYADVITQFFELVAGDNSDTQKDLIHNRLSMLAQSTRYLDIHNQRHDTHYLFDACDSKNCQYLNSFYFSVLLYHKYLEDPLPVLEEVSKVLLKEKTTYQMLEDLNLFGYYNDQEVIDGIQYLKKYSMER